MVISVIRSAILKFENLISTIQEKPNYLKPKNNSRLKGLTLIEPKLTW